MDEDSTQLVLHLLKPLGKFSFIQLNNLFYSSSLNVHDMQDKKIYNNRKSWI